MQIEAESNGNIPRQPATTERTPYYFRLRLV